MTVTRSGWLLAYVATIFLANWLITRYGVIPVGFGLMAPAGVLAVGLGFTARDLAHEAAGSRAVIGAILVGALFSALLSPALAFASGSAFLVSELADMAVYTPLRRRRWLLAVALSNTVGAVIDSALFLWLAFGSLTFFWGQVWGKLAMTLLAVALLALWRSRRREAVAA